MGIVKWFKDLFSESSDVSMTRFLSFISVMSAVVIAVSAVAKEADLNATSMLCGVFLAAGFTGKVMQRSIESKESVSEKEQNG